MKIAPIKKRDRVGDCRDYQKRVFQKTLAVL